MKAYVHINKDLHMNVQSFICDSPKLETTQISSNRWVDKQIVVDTDIDIDM